METGVVGHLHLECEVVLTMNVTAARCSALTNETAAGECLKRGALAGGEGDRACACVCADADSDGEGAGERDEEAKERWGGTAQNCELWTQRLGTRTR